MRSRAVRTTLTLLAVAAVGAAAYFIWDIEKRESQRRTTVAAFENLCASALREAWDMRSAQQAYVASGQSEEYWFGKVTGSVESLRLALSGMQSSAPASGKNVVAEALEGVQQFEQLDRRIRNYAATGQKLLASDIIFLDGLQATARIISALERVAAAAREESGAAYSKARREELVPLGAALGALLFALFLLAPVRNPALASEPNPETETATATPTMFDLRLRPADEERTGHRHTESGKRADTASRPSGSAQRRPEPTNGTNRSSDTRNQIPQVQGQNTAASRSVGPNATTSAHQDARADLSDAASQPADIQTLAAVCTDLARLADTEKLPAILERTAQTLDASGLILWVADPDGTELLPVAVHGYPASVLSRLGTIKTDADNATAASFRTGMVQTVRANSSSSGAIAAPLVTASGCRGVMTAEVRHNAEQQPSRLASASIVAAQLATLVGPLPTESSREKAAI